jgi:hypothetical protein
MPTSRYRQSDCVDFAVFPGSAAQPLPVEEDKAVRWGFRKSLYRNLAKNSRISCPCDPKSTVDSQIGLSAGKRLGFSKLLLAAI